MVFTLVIYINWSFRICKHQAEKYEKHLHKTFQLGEILFDLHSVVKKEISPFSLKDHPRKLQMR